MIDEFESVEDGARLEADVAVIGAGAAGIVIARRLAASRLRTVVVESGGFEFDPDAQRLTAAAVGGLPLRALEPTRLLTPDAGRFRMFGGTTYAWAGICAQLDLVDFERREWLPDSGWPLTKADLDPWYERAERELELDPELFGDDAVRKLEALVPDVGPDLLRIHAWQFTRVKQLGLVHRAELTAARNVLALLHATAVELHTDPAASVVEHAVVRGRGGRTAHLDAGVFVLAAGGIENARILLASNATRPRGLGNEHDLVGRFFTEHVRCHLGVLTALDAAAFTSIFGPLWLTGSKTSRLGFVLAPEAQRQHAVAQAALYLVESPLPADWPRARALAEAGGLASPSRRHAALPRAELLVDAEQAPNRASRVTLAQERDELGLPVARVDWRLTDLDLRTLSVSAQVLGRELERIGLAQLWLDGWLSSSEPDWRLNVHDVFHHAGTTRMARDPTGGVTDEHCRVHGIANLYVAGSSVFPTGGHANPTLTILALALRLAERLATRRA